MNNSIPKLLFTLTFISVASLLFINSAQAATFNTMMKFGVVNANSQSKEVVIYNDDFTKCLSANGQPGNSLTYSACRMDDSDTWSITSEGKIKNTQNGKCLSTPKGEESLVLTDCDFMHFRNSTAHELIIFGQIVEDDQSGEEIAGVRY